MKKLLKNTDFLILICVIILAAIGIVGIYTAGYATDVNKDEYIKQIIFFGISFVVMIALWLVPNTMFEFGGYIIYLISLVLLVAVLFTSKMMGASSWFNLGGFLYQPSELMKIGFILTYARFLLDFKRNKANNIKSKLLYITILFFILAIPVLLILLQPDFGTAAVFLVMALFMMFKSGLKYRYIFIGLALCVILVPLGYNFILTDTQKARIDVFLNPELDPLGSGYNAIQSQLAVGSGMLFGTGLLKGVQTQLGYIPIKTSDFIYSVLSEELGFVMSVIIIVLFVFLIIKLIIISMNTQDEYFSIAVIGIAGMFFFHFVQNIGMAIGLLPITGVPLSFVSYGGSNMITSAIAIGIVLNVSSRKQKSLIF